MEIEACLEKVKILEKQIESLKAQLRNALKEIERFKYHNRKDYENQYDYLPWEDDRERT